MKTTPIFLACLAALCWTLPRSAAESTSLASPPPSAALITHGKGGARDLGQSKSTGSLPVDAVQFAAVAGADTPRVDAGKGEAKTVRLLTIGKAVLATQTKAAFKAAAARFPQSAVAILN